MTAANVLTINDRTGTGAVFGMHDGSGPVHWKRLATGGNLDGRIQAWDYASLPAGSLIGFHEHLNSDEVWIVLEGSGDFTMEGVPRPLVAGDVMRTPIGGSHSMLNPDDADSHVEFLVVTLAPPRLGVSTASDQGAAKSEVQSLNDGPVVYTDHEGNRMAVRWSTIEPGEVRGLGGPEHQCLAFTVDGDTTMQWIAQSHDLSAGSALAIPSGQTVELTPSGAAPCRLLEIELTTS